MSYWELEGKTIESLFIGVLIIAIFVIINIFIITKINKKKIRLYFLISILIQIIISVLDNYFFQFPLLEFDARAFEELGWKSYKYNINVGRGAYNYYFINPIYRILTVRSAIIFNMLNITFTTISNTNVLKILNILKINYKIRKKCMLILLFSPISLIFKSGILREAIIYFFISYSFLFFTKYCKKKSNKNLFFSFIFILLGSIFHSGVIFLAIGFIYYLFKKSKKIKQKIRILILLILIFSIIYIFKDIFLTTFGSMDTKKIISHQNDKQLLSAGSAYLVGVKINTIKKTILYLPLKIYYFLYSPMPDMFRSILDILTFLLNSCIYIYLSLNIIFKMKKNKNNSYIKALMLSLLITIIIFSIGSVNAGTAMRHRDKILFLFLIIFSNFKKKLNY